MLTTLFILTHAVPHTLDLCHIGHKWGTHWTCVPHTLDSSTWWVKHVAMASISPMFPPMEKQYTPKSIAIELDVSWQGLIQNLSMRDKQYMCFKLLSKWKLTPPPLFCRNFKQNMNQWVFLYYLDMGHRTLFTRRKGKPGSSLMKQWQIDFMKTFNFAPLGISIICQTDLIHTLWQHTWQLIPSIWIDFDNNMVHCKPFYLFVNSYPFSIMNMFKTSF